MVEGNNWCTEVRRLLFFSWELFARPRNGMRVLLVNPPTLHRWRPVTDGLAHEVKVPYMRSLLMADANLVGNRSTLPGEHLGLQSLAASLRAAGHDPEILDAAGEQHASLAETLNAIRGPDEYDLVGFTGPTDVVGENRWLMRGLRRRGFTGSIVLGNDHATLNAEEELIATSDLDFVLRGEGERSIVRLVECLEANGELQSVPNLSWRGLSGPQHNPPGPSLDLDELPWPTRDRTASVVSGGFSASLFTKRGCLYRCAHCTTGQVSSRSAFNPGPAWRTKTARAATHEFLSLVDQFGLSHVTIVDDLFVAKDESSREWAREFAELLLEARNRATFMVDCRIDSFDASTLALLKQAGLTRVFVGVESGSSSSLRQLNKRYGRVEARSQLQLLAEMGIHAILGFIFLTPSETRGSMAESVDFLTSAGMHDYRLFTQRARIYPGSALEEDVRLRGDRTGTYPFYGFRLHDPGTQAVAEAIHDLSKRVGRVVGRVTLSPQQQTRLLTVFAAAVSDMCEMPSSVLDDDPIALGRLVENAALDCEVALTGSEGFE